MVRGEAVFLILAVFMHINIVHMGSIFDQFTTPDKKDKNKMLMYLRGLLKHDTPTTTAKGLKGVTVAPGTLKIEQIWDKQSLPDRSDKSKMLAYLRGMKAPSNIYSVYEEPQHQGLIQTLHSETNDNSQNTAQNDPPTGQNNQDGQNVVDSGVKESEQEVTWGNPATQITILRPAEKESDSDTCFWRVPQSPAAGHDSQLRLVQQQTNPDPVANPGSSASGDFENVGEKVIAFFECAKTKFWKSYAKIQKKICGIF